MTALPPGVLVHRATVSPLLSVGSSVGPKYGPDRDIDCLFVEAPGEAVDERPQSQTKDSTIGTRGQFVAQYTDGPIPPGSLITFTHRPGKSWQVVTAAWNDHPVAPSSTQGWVI